MSAKAAGHGPAGGLIVNGRRDMADGAKVRSESAGFAADDVAQQLAVHPLEHADVSLASFERQCDVAAAIAGAHVAPAGRRCAIQRERELQGGLPRQLRVLALPRIDKRRRLAGARYRKNGKLALVFNAKGYAGKDHAPQRLRRQGHAPQRLRRQGHAPQRAVIGRACQIHCGSRLPVAAGVQRQGDANMVRELDREAEKERQKRRGRKGEAEKERRKIRNRPKRHIEAKGARSGSVV